MSTILSRPQCVKGISVMASPDSYLDPRSWMNAHSWSTVEGRLSLPLLDSSIWCQTCSMGLRSGLCAGHSMTPNFPPSRKLLAFHAVSSVAFSCTHKISLNSSSSSGPQHVDVMLLFDCVIYNHQLGSPCMESIQYHEGRADSTCFLVRVSTSLSPTRWQTWGMMVSLIAGEPGPISKYQIRAMLITPVLVAVCPNRATEVMVRSRARLFD